VAMAATAIERNPDEIFMMRAPQDRRLPNLPGASALCQSYN